MNATILPLGILRTALAGLTILAAGSVLGQETDAKKSQEAPVPPKLTRFDLDFPGGTPGELIAAIQKAQGRPLNAIVPPLYAEVKLPPLKMRGVDAAQLFDAMIRCSMTVENAPLGERLLLQYGFKTEHTPSDDSVWYFFTTPASGYPSSKRVCYFFLLTPYLERGLTVDDITTAIQTGWTMLGNSAGGELRYHAETKLLIAVCDEDHLFVVKGALSALKEMKPNTPAPVSAAKPAEEPKTVK